MLQFYEISLSSVILVDGIEVGTESSYDYEDESVVNLTHRLADN